MAQLGSGSGSGYPSTIDTTQVWVNGPNAAPDSNARMDAELVNDFAAAIVALQTELGTNPSGAFASVAARLSQMAPVPVAGGFYEGEVLSSSNVPALVAANVVPVGARVKAVVCRVTTGFSTEHGLTAFHVGGMGLENGWGDTIGITLGTETSGANFRRGDMPLATAPESIVFTALGGYFGSTGAIFLQVIYETYTVS